ncbi:unnamed protein product [Adineta steineri]|uniref:ADP ribosyltransferase domain-containing protein n=1 Tax=Adineta steineri TaxID=433720 RepID=A0A819B732_9BILA|nr:unnamed protein product [Adineta steineri]
MSMATKNSQKNPGSVSSSGASSTPVTTTTPTIRQRMAQNYLLVWVDASIDQTNKDCQNALTQLRAVVNNVIIFNQSDACIQFLDQINDAQVFVITSESLGQDLVPEIHGMSKLDAIYIFSGNIFHHQQWTKDWNKIKGVHNNIKDICDALKECVKQINQNSIPISFVTTREAVYGTRLNQLEPNYIYIQIFKDILLKREHYQEQAIEILAMYCCNLYSDNIDELNVINEFKSDYDPKHAIWWYTRECFIYQMLNRALRTLDADIIIKIGFFIHDLHQQIDQLYKQQLSNYRGNTFIVYRGQGLLKSDFDKLRKTKGGFLSFNNFLSTSVKKDISLDFAERGSTKADMVGILFIMTIDPRFPSTPFASINEVSYYKAEEEILFSMHTMFRIGLIKQIDNNDQLYEVELQLIADEQLHRLTECVSHQVGGITVWERLGYLLLKTGHLDKAEELYKVVLQQPLNESYKAIYYNRLGDVKDRQGDYVQAKKYYEQEFKIKGMALPEDYSSLATFYNFSGVVYNELGEYTKALSFYEKALEMKEKTLPANHSSLAIPYSNIGLLYNEIGEYTKALSFYEKALGVEEKTLSENHPDLAITYTNIGSMYSNMGDYSKAPLFCEKAIEIWSKTRSTNHPCLVTSYNNIGLVYGNMGEHLKALLYHQKALEIKENTLPANYPSLAISYGNIGSVYSNMGDHLKALSFYEKALEVEEKTLSENHPDLAISYNNIGLLYNELGEYTKALSSYEKALAIEEKTLPVNHPDLATFYNNIGILCYNMKEYTKALSYYERGLDIRKVSLPPNHPELKAVEQLIEIVKKRL